MQRLITTTCSIAAEDLGKEKAQRIAKAAQRRYEELLISDCSATADITVQGDDGACAGLIAGGTTMSSIKSCEVTDGSITAEGNITWGFGALCGAP